MFDRGEEGTAHGLLQNQIKNHRQLFTPTRAHDQPLHTQHTHTKQNKPKKPTKTKQKIGVIIVSMGLIAAGYIAVGSAGYLAFPGPELSSNILNTFAADDPVMQVARAVIGLMVTGHYPLAFVPARVAFNDLLATLFNVAPTPRWADVAFTLAFFGGTLATALVVTDLGAVLHLIGGTCAGMMIFLLPGLLCWNGAIIKATTTNFDAAAGEEGEGEEGALDAGEDALEGGSRAAGEGAGGGGGLAVPLVIDKKAGLRTHGVLFVSSAKTWWGKSMKGGLGGGGGFVDCFTPWVLFRRRLLCALTPKPSYQSINQTPRSRPGPRHVFDCGVFHHDRHCRRQHRALSRPPSFMYNLCRSQNLTNF
jgi:hypothetical protein